MEKKEDFLPYVYSILRRLNCGDVNTYEQRIKSQKTQYFAQLFGVSLRYKYNLYLRGPYSPGLANDLYKIKELKIEPILNKFIPEELEERFENVKKYIKGMENRQLEITATFHWLVKVAEMPIEKAKNKLKELKSVTEKELIYVIDKFDQYEQIKTNYN